MARTTLLAALLALFSGIIVSCRQSPQAYVAKGNTFFDAGKYDDAIINYKKALQRDGKFGEGYYRLGLAELKTGKTREAFAALNSANTLLPNRTDVKAKFADFLLLAYFSDKKRPAALYAQLTKLSDELIAQDPNSYDGLRIKGAVAWSDGHLKDAEEFFRRANTRKPMEAGLVVMWVQVLFKDGQFAEGERLAQELIQAHKEVGAIYDVLYAHYRSQNRLPEAENILRAKVDNNPHAINDAMELAMFYAGAGKRDQLNATLQRVLDDPKTFPDARLKVGDFYAALHDWPEALKQYEDGAKSNPKEKNVYLKRIADSWLAQGKGDQAAGVIGEILKDQPNDEAAKAVNASLLLKTGKPEKIQAAVNDLQELVKKQPENPLLQFALGQALLTKGDQNQAITQFRELVKKRPRYLPPILALAELSLSKGDYAQAQQYANDALAINPRLAEARLARATALLGTQKYAEARTELAGLASDFPQNTEVQFRMASLELAEKKYPQAEARFQQLYEKDKFRGLAGLVDAYRLQGQLDKAFSRLNLELGKSPNTAAIHFLLADTAVRASKYDLAMQQYQQLLLLAPRAPQVRLRLAGLYQLKGDMNKAIANLQAAQELAPNDPVVVGALADAYRMAGRNAEAMAYYRRLLVLDPQNANAMNNLAYTLLDTGGTPDEAQKLAEQALQKAPKNPNFADTLGMVYLRKNLEDSAMQVFSGLTQRFPDNPTFRYHYALSLSQKGQKAKAKTELEVALRKSPPDDLRRNIQSSLAKIQQ